jgi:hypothetical protein
MDRKAETNFTMEIGRTFPFQDLFSCAIGHLATPEKHGSND